MSKEQSGRSCQKRALRPESLTSRSLPSFSYTPHTLVFCAVVKPTCLARSLPEPSPALGRDCDAQPQQREPGGSQLAGPLVPASGGGSPRSRLDKDRRSLCSRPLSGSKAPGAADSSARRGRSSAHPAQVRQTRAGPATCPGQRGTSLGRDRDTAGPRAPEWKRAAAGETRACVRVTELSPASSSSSSSLLSAESRLLPRREGRE